MFGVLPFDCYRWGVGGLSWAPANLSSPEEFTLQRVAVSRTVRAQAWPHRAKSGTEVPELNDPAPY